MARSSTYCLMLLLISNFIILFYYYPETCEESLQILKRLIDDQSIKSISIAIYDYSLFL